MPIDKDAKNHADLESFIDVIIDDHASFDDDMDFKSFRERYAVHVVEGNLKADSYITDITYSQVGRTVVFTWDGHPNDGKVVGSLD